MKASILFDRARSRLRHDEAGFALLELVVAMGVIFLALTVLAYTALVGFKDAGLARQRQVATAVADKLVEETKGLSWDTISHGLSDSDLSGDSNIVTCGTSYKYKSCSGEAIVHNPGLANTIPLVPHRGTFGSAQGLPDTFSWSVYVTQATGVPSSGVVRLTVSISWSSSERAGLSSLSTQALLFQPQGTGDASTHLAGANGSFFYGAGSVSSGKVDVTPNSGVYNGTGVTGLPTWDSVDQSMYSIDADVEQEQVTKVNGQTTLTSTSNTVSGTTTSTGGTSTVSTADDDPSTTAGTTSSPSAITQAGPTTSVTGGGNAMLLNQYTGTYSTIGYRSSSSATGGSSVTLSKPAGVAAGDVLIADVGFVGNAGDTITPPAGWTLVRRDSNQTNPGKPTSGIFFKAATGSEPANYTFSTSGGGAEGGMSAYTGVDTSYPVDISGAASGSSNSPTTPSITTTVANDRLVAFWTIRSSSIASSDVQMTQRWSAANGAGGAAADQAFAGPGSTGTRTATASGSGDWAAQVIALQPAIVVGTAGTEAGSTVSVTRAQSGTPCGTPVQNDNQPCAYSTQSYSSAQKAYLQTSADLSGSGLGKCPLYTFNPPSNNGTNYAYGRRASTTGDGKVTEAVSRYYGTHIFGQLCAGIADKPTNWPGYLVKYDAANSVCQATAEAGISSAAPSVTTAGTITVYNGAGTTSFAVPTSGGWSTAPANVNFTTSGGYVYTLTANLGSNPSFTTQVPSGASGSATRTEAKSVVGSPVVGTITYQLTDPAGHVLINVTMNIDLGNLIAYAKYSPAT